MRQGPRLTKESLQQVSSFSCGLGMLPFGGNKMEALAIESQRRLMIKLQREKGISGRQSHNWCAVIPQACNLIRGCRLRHDLEQSIRLPGGVGNNKSFQRRSGCHILVALHV